MNMYAFVLMDTSELVWKNQSNEMQKFVILGNKLTK